MGAKFLERLAKMVSDRVFRNLQNGRDVFVRLAF